MQVINRTTKAVFNLDPQQAENLIENFDFIENKNRSEAKKSAQPALDPEEMKILGLAAGSKPKNKPARRVKTKTGAEK